MIRFFSLVLFFSLITEIKAQVGNSKPNVVFILVDDLGWTDLGCFGSDFYQTPHVDRLAADGVRFDNAYAACTVCSPTRASIMTGKYPATLNLTDWIEGHKYPRARLKVPDWTMQLDTSETTLADVFRTNGYVTGHFGKWHLGEDSLFWPENHGFDVNVGGWAKGSPLLNPAKGYKGYFSPYGNPRLSANSRDEYLTERLASEACAFVRENRDQPFFLNLWFYNVHTPLQARKEKVEKYQALVDASRHHQNPTYAAMVEHMDDAVGEVVQQLKALDLYQNTIIVFTSDNGGLIGGGKRQVTSNYPLRSGKGDVYEGGVRVPLIIRTPSMNSQRGETCQVPVVSADLMPTLIDLVGFQVKKAVVGRFDGVTISTLLDDVHATLKREALFWHYPHYHTEGATPYSAIRKGDYKLIHFYEDDSYELYNLKADVGESVDLIEKELLVAKRLKKNLQSWLQKVEAQMPTENPNYDPLNSDKR